MSVPGQHYVMKRNVKFRNVVSSTDDPKYGGMDWLDLWENQTQVRRGMCCACNRKTAVVGGHIVLGDGTHSSHAGKYATNLIEGNRVFIAPICGTCNADSGVLCAAFDVPILNLCAFFVGERPNLDQFTWDFYGEEDADDETFDRETAKAEKNHAVWIATKRREGICDYDRALLQNSPISGRGRISIPVYRG